jgi:hypothetical protein
VAPDSGRCSGEGNSGLSLLWPFSYHSFQYPHGYYLAAMAAFVLIDAVRCRGRALRVAGVDRRLVARR